MGLMLLCRPGFEPECAAEIADAAAQAGATGYPRAERGGGHVFFEDDGSAARAVRFDALIFAREKLEGIVGQNGRATG